MLADLQALKLQQQLLQDRNDVNKTLIEIVSTLRKTKARSKFIFQKELNLSIFKFEPNEWIELVGEGEKSIWSKPFEDYAAKEKERKKNAEERKKANEVLQEKMKQPLNGNLALNFLFKDQDLSQIIKMKVKTEGGDIRQSEALPTGQKLHEGPYERAQSMVLTPDEDLFEEFKKVPVNTIQGYFKTKHRLKVGNVNDFISKLRNTKFLNKFLSSKDVENRGIKQVIEEFQRRVSARFGEDQLLCNEMEMHLEEMQEYVMFQLHQSFFFNNAPSPDEIFLQDKVTVMQFLEPEAYGVPKKLDSTSKEMVFAWKMAIKQL